MAILSKHRLRATWFQVHKWIGLALAVLIVPLCLSGSWLVYADAIDAAMHPERRSEVAPALAPSAYAAAAREHAPGGQRLVSLTLPAEGAVVANLAAPPRPGGARPVRSTLWLDPADGQLLGRSAPGGGVTATIHSLHGNLLVPGAGRQLVGGIGLAMLVSSLTGLWLWWPFKGGFRRGLRWKRAPDLSGNLHHLGGFWICLPLAVLSLTGAWIAFPALFAALSGDPAPQPRRAPPAPVVAPRLSPDEAVRLASPLAQGRLASIAWPAGPDARWKIGYQGAGEVLVDDRNGRASLPRPPQPPTIARLMRRIHEGEAGGALWKLVVFVGGLIPAALAVTGVLMWWNSRVRSDAMSRRHEKRRGDASAPGQADLDVSGASL